MIVVIKPRERHSLHLPATVDRIIQGEIVRVEKGVPPLVIVHTRNSFTSTEGKPPADRLVESVIAFVAGRGKTSSEHETLRRALPTIDFSVSQLQANVRSVYPDFADAALAKPCPFDLLKTEPSRRLLEEDLAGVLQRRSSLGSVTRQRRADTVTIPLKEVQYEERQTPEQTSTVTVGWGDHDAGVAVLLVPRNASTLFEVTEGAAEISWAYDVIARRGGSVVHEKLVRD